MVDEDYSMCEHSLAAKRRIICFAPAWLESNRIGHSGADKAIERFTKTEEHFFHMRLRHRREQLGLLPPVVSSVYAKSMTSGKREVMLFINAFRPGGDP